MDDFLALAEQRRSIRSFTPSPLDFEIVLNILRAGTFAPSPGDLQPWKFILISEEKMRKDVIAFCPNQDWMHNATILIALVGEKSRVLEFFTSSSEQWMNQSIGACMQNMLLEATSQGVGACWVAGCDDVNLSEVLRLEEGDEVFSILALGYSAETPSPKQVKSLDDVVYFNTMEHNWQSSFQNDLRNSLGSKMKTVREEIVHRKEKSTFAQNSRKLFLNTRDRIRRIFTKKK